MRIGRVTIGGSYPPSHLVARSRTLDPYKSVSGLQIEGQMGILGAWESYLDEKEKGTCHLNGIES